MDTVLVLLLAAFALLGAEYDVRDFGATGDGVTTDTAAIQKALDACAESGGRVRLTRGKYLTGTLYLGNNTDFHLEKDAVLLGSANLADYNLEDAYPQNYGCKEEGWRGSHLMIVLEKHDVRITGEGVIDGNARAFMQDEPTWYGYFGWVDGFLESRDHNAQARPGQEIVFVESRDVGVEGVTLRDMACWSCFFHGCENVRVRGVTVRNDRRYANTDGFDIDSCRNVVVTECDIETGDDGFAVRGDLETLKDKSCVCENVLISNNTCAVSANGVRIGVGYGVVRNVKIVDLRVGRAANGIQLQSAYRKQGGLSISDVRIENVTISNALKGIVIGGQTSVAGIPLEDVRFKNITIDSPRPIEVNGEGLTHPRRISFDGIRVRSAEYPFLVRNAEVVSFADVQFGWGRFADLPKKGPESSGAYISDDTRLTPYDAQSYPEGNFSPAPEGDFGALRRWMDAQPDRLDEDAFCHFLKRYYGTAWRYVRHYLRELYALEINRFKDVHLVGTDDPYIAPRLPRSYRQRAAYLWKRAIDVAEIIDKDEPAYADHVRRSTPPGLPHAD